MRISRPVVTGWALLVAGGWAATLWLGEPSATAGPRPAPAPGSAPGDAAPGPQPEGSCATARVAPSPVASAAPLLKTENMETRAVQRLCDYAVIRR
ncbi:hypothetical protein [Streptomyces sp. NPDC057418]|uniref:hypothetical protein n=1 Tax=unclassified Streptomyces TaxID=2593676 RepID=UPI0036CC4B1F